MALPAGFQFHLIEGFETYGAFAGLQTLGKWSVARNKYTSQPGTPQIVEGRFAATKGLQVGAQHNVQLDLRKNLPHVGAIQMGLAFKRTWQKDQSLVNIYSSNNRWLGTVILTEEGSVRWWKNSGIGGQVHGVPSLKSFQYGVWHYMEVYYKSGPTQELKVWVNGELVLAMAGTDLQSYHSGQSSSNVLDNTIYQVGHGVEAYTSWSTGLTIDDIYIASVIPGTGQSLGDLRVEPIRATSSDIVTGFTTFNAINAVDAVADDAPAGDTTYLQADGIGSKAIFDSTDALRSTPKDIYAFAVTGTARKSDLGTRTIDNCVKLNGTEYYSGNPEYLAAELTSFQRVWTVNPQTGTEWTRAQVEAARFGAKVIS